MRPKERGRAESRTCFGRGKVGVELRQSYRRVAKLALVKHQRYAGAHQFKRANKSLRKLKTYLGRVIRGIGRRIADNDVLQEVFARELSLARRVLERHQRGCKVYSLRAAAARGNARCYRPNRRDRSTEDAITASATGLTTPDAASVMRAPAAFS
jgi:transposase, IS5 family